MSDPTTARFPRGGAWITILSLAAVLAILIVSLQLAPRPSGESPGESFAGTDAAATEQLAGDGVEPWFSPIFEPGSGEIESGLFAAQAALGGALFGYAVGRLRGRRSESETPAVMSGAPGPADPPSGLGA